MERGDLVLYEKIEKILQSYKMEDILLMNDMTEEDVLFVLYYNHGIKLPEEL